MGDVIKNAMDTPTGIFAEVKPRNRGMLEQEQNGVTAPKPAPNIYPTNLFLPDKYRRTRSTFNDARSHAII